MQVGELALKVHQWRVISRDVARAARADTAAPGSLDHRGHDLRALPHAEVVIGAPDRDLGDHPVGPAPLGEREAARNALDVGENTVAPLIVQAIEGLAEVALVRLVRALRVLLTWTRLLRASDTAGAPCPRIAPKNGRALPVRARI